MSDYFTHSSCLQFISGIESGWKYKKSRVKINRKKYKASGILNSSYKKLFVRLKWGEGTEKLFFRVFFGCGFFNLKE